MVGEDGEEERGREEARTEVRPGAADQGDGVGDRARAQIVRKEAEGEGADEVRLRRGPDVVAGVDELAPPGVARVRGEGGVAARVVVVAEEACDLRQRASERSSAGDYGTGRLLSWLSITGRW